MPKVLVDLGFRFLQQNLELGYDWQVQLLLGQSTCNKSCCQSGSGWCTVGRLVASYLRDLRFESNNRFYIRLKIKEKEVVNGKWDKWHFYQKGTYCFKVCYYWGSGCGSVGRAVASDTREPGFQSSRRQILLTINCRYRKVGKKIKRGRELSNF